MTDDHEIWYKGVGIFVERSSDFIEEFSSVQQLCGFRHAKVVKSFPSYI